MTSNGAWKISNYVDGKLGDAQGWVYGNTSWKNWSGQCGLLSLTRRRQWVLVDELDD